MNKAQRLILVRGVSLKGRREAIETISSWVAKALGEKTEVSNHVYSIELTESIEWVPKSEMRPSLLPYVHMDLLQTTFGFLVQSASRFAVVSAPFPTSTSMSPYALLVSRLGMSYTQMLVVRGYTGDIETPAFEGHKEVIEHDLVSFEPIAGEFHIAEPGVPGLLLDRLGLNPQNASDGAGGGWAAK